MAFSAGLLTNFGSSGVASFTSPSLALAASDWNFLAMAVDNFSSTPTVTPTVTGPSTIVWDILRNEQMLIGGLNAHLMTFRCMATVATTGTVTVDFSTQIQHSGTVKIARVTGCTTGLNGAAAVVQSTGGAASSTNPSISLSNLQSGHALIGAIGAQSDWRADSPFTELSSGNPSLAWRDSIGDPSMSWTLLSGAQDNVMFIAELGSSASLSVPPIPGVTQTVAASLRIPYYRPTIDKGRRPGV